MVRGQNKYNFTDVVFTNCLRGGLAMGRTCNHVIIFSNLIKPLKKALYIYESAFLFPFVIYK